MLYYSHGRDRERNTKMPKLPTILEHYLETTEQYAHGELSKSHLLHEAEWCYYNATENEGSAAYEFSASSKRALKRYIDRLKAEGVKPRRDFD